jgi:hypothetical protein
MRSTRVPPGEALGDGSHQTSGRRSMTQKQNPTPDDASNTVKDPDEWTTGDQAMTGAQKSYLKTLSDEAGEEFDDSLTKAEASKRIDELQQQTGRGVDH